MRDAKPEGRDACTQGSAAEAKEKRRVRWLRKGLAAVGKRSGSDHAIPKVVIGPPIPVMPSLKDHEIRLVHINPSTGPEGMIHCNLVTVNLEESPQFEALSYEWGPALPNVQIMMNGRSVSVRENLWWALRHLQLEDSRRVIWIDALCINQQDMAERNHQVAQMGQIYRAATRCIAWIGRERIVHESTSQVDDCEPAMEFIKKCQNQSGTKRADYSKGLSSQGRQEHDSLEFFCRRRYWSRLWIIQEILLPSVVTVQCGTHEVSWRDLGHIFNNLTSFVHASYQFSISSSAPFRLNQQIKSNAGGYSSTRIGGFIPPKLADLVLQFKGAQCEDPRDTVFGLLSLARSCCRDAVQADYSKSPEQICTTLLIHQITYHPPRTSGSKSLDIAADIQELCQTIVFRPKQGGISRADDTSIASASMKAFRAIPDPLGPTKAGRVVWTVPASQLKMAFEDMESRIDKSVSNADDTDLSTLQETEFSNLSKSMKKLPPSGAKEQSEDLLETFMKTLDPPACEKWNSRINLQTRTIYIVYSFYKVIAHPVYERVLPRFTHLFLTDMGLSGMAVLDIKLGHIAYSMADPDPVIYFCKEGTRPGLEDKVKGICLDSTMPFQELVSRVI
jgi:hypothetical protein